MTYYEYRIHLIISLIAAIINNKFNKSYRIKIIYNISTLWTY